MGPRTQGLQSLALITNNFASEHMKGDNTDKRKLASQNKCHAKRCQLSTQLRNCQNLRQVYYLSICSGTFTQSKGYRPEDVTSVGYETSPIKPSLALGLKYKPSVFQQLYSETGLILDRACRDISHSTRKSANEISY